MGSFSNLYFYFFWVWRIFVFVFPDLREEGWRNQFC